MAYIGVESSLTTFFAKFEKFAKIYHRIKIQDGSCEAFVCVSRLKEAAFVGSMSLVSYANSDDSSDNDSNEANEQARRFIRKEVPDTNNLTSLSLPVAKNEALIPKGSDESGETTIPKSIGNLFSSLPAPWISSISWAIKSKTGKLDGKEKRAHTVKITLPVAEESDSDDESPGIKERKPISGPQKPSGLSSLLPKPKHSVVVKENNPNRPAAKISNRPLIPDSLRRKQAKKVETPLQRKKQVKKHDSDDDDEEEDQGSISFFSLEEKEGSLSVEKDITSGDNPDLKLETETITSKPWNSGLINRSSTNTTNTSTAANPSFVRAEEVSELEEKRDIVSLQPSYSHTEPDPYSYQGYHTVSMRPPDANSYSIGQATESQVTTTENYANSGEPYYNYNDEQQNETPQQPQYGVDWHSQVEPTTQNHSQELKELGGKRGRGEENINIIDVNADDQVGSSSDWKSRYRLEDAEYRPQSKKKENLPSSQERRKHQITYLAFQAKEAEWELRNQWAANSQTRKQTQSKYGF